MRFFVRRELERFAAFFTDFRRLWRVELGAELILELELAAGPKYPLGGELCIAEMLAEVCCAAPS